MPHGPQITATIKDWYFTRQHELRGRIYGDKRNQPCLDGDVVELSVIMTVSEYPDEFIVKTLGNSAYLLPKADELKLSPFNQKKIIEDIKNGRKP